MEVALFLAWGLLVLANLASILLAAWRVSPNGVAAPPPDDRPPVSIVVPVRGVEAFTPETLSHAFRLDWDAYELVFCVADAGDPIVAEIRAAMAAHPGVAARILVGDDRISANPKLNNCFKGWQAARHDWVVLADSNVLMPRDYVQHLLAARREGTGLICSMPLGSRPVGFWAEVECAFLNGLQARWQYAGAAVGLGFAQGKNMLWRKPLLEANGGIGALAAEIAEDAAATKLINGLGLQVDLVAAPFEQPLGRRGLGDVWMRQGRWARLRRVTFPFYFAPEILLGAVPPLVVGLLAAAAADKSLVAAATVTAAAIYLPELMLVQAKNWHVSAFSVPAMVVRDLMIPFVWFRSWLGKPFNWRGNMMTIGTRTSELEATPTAS